MWWRWGWWLWLWWMKVDVQVAEEERAEILRKAAESRKLGQVREAFIKKMLHKYGIFPWYFFPK